MSTDIKIRLKKIVDYAKYHGIAPTQKEFGEKLGYNSEQYTSKILSGNAQSYADFAQRVKKLIPDLNTDWLLTGVGAMLHGQTATGDNNTQINGNANSVNNSAEITSLIAEIKAQREMFQEIISKKDAQIDQLLKIISK